MLFALLVATLTGDPPPRPLPAATTHRYRIEITATSLVDLTAMGAPPQTQEQAVLGIVSITLADSANGRTVRVVVDSAILSAGEVPVPPEMAASAKGMTLHGFVDPSGRLLGVRASSENPVGALLQATLHDFFPRARPGVRAGDSWTDTTEVTTSPGGGTMQTRTISTFTVGGPEAFQGTAATGLSAVFTNSLSGTMQTPGGEASMTGTGSGSSNYYLSIDGRFLGGTRTTTQESVVKMQAAPVEFPVRSTTVMVVTPLP